MRKKYIYVLFLIIMMISMSGNTVLADGGGGTGGGKEQLLQLVSCDPSDGNKDVAIDIKMVLNFNKNVIHDSVVENNKTMFTLTDTNENNVEIEIEIGDVQIEPELKRTITIVPKNNLSNDMQYKLTIKSGMKSKSGDAMESDAIINFTTVKGELQETITENNVQEQIIDVANTQNTENAKDEINAPNSGLDSTEDNDQQQIIDVNNTEKIENTPNTPSTSNTQNVQNGELDSTEDIKSTNKKEIEKQQPKIEAPISEPVSPKQNNLNVVPIVVVILIFVIAGAIYFKKRKKK